MPRPRRRTPGTKIPVKPRSHFAGGHRSRVTPVPIPNTEVKPATADGTARETVWESRSLPALLLRRSPIVHGQSGFFVCVILSSEFSDSELHAHTSSLPLPSSQLKTVEGRQRAGGDVRLIEARPDPFHRARKACSQIAIHRDQEIDQLSQW